MATIDLPGLRRSRGTPLPRALPYPTFKGDEPSRSVQKSVLRASRPATFFFRAAPFFGEATHGLPVIVSRLRAAEARRAAQSVPETHHVRRAALCRDARPHEQNKCHHTKLQLAPGTAAPRRCPRRRQDAPQRAPFDPPRPSSVVSGEEFHQKLSE